MLPAEELFVYVYMLIHDLMLGGAIVVPDRPGPAPACTDAELLAIAIVRHLLGRRSEAGFLAEVARDWGHPFPRLPHQSEASRRTRWLWGAFEQIRITPAARLPENDCQQVDTPAILLKVIAEWRNRIETTFSEITDRMELARHGARTFWGLLTRTAATIAAHTLQLTCLTQA